MTPTTYAEAVRQLKAAGEAVQVNKNGRRWYLRWREKGKCRLRKLSVTSPEDLLTRGLLAMETKAE